METMIAGTCATSLVPPARAAVGDASMVKAVMTKLAFDLNNCDTLSMAESGRIVADVTAATYDLWVVLDRVHDKVHARSSSTELLFTPGCQSQHSSPAEAVDAAATTLHWTHNLLPMVGEHLIRARDTLNTVAEAGPANPARLD